MARCVFWLFVSAFLIFLFFFARKRFHQVVLLFGLSTGLIVFFRLLSLRGNDVAELTSEAYFLLAISILYGLFWLGARYLRSESRPNTRKRHR